MAARSDERTEFLSDLLLTATSGITYWAEVTNTEDLAAKVRAGAAISSITLIDNEESTKHTINLDDVARGLALLGSAKGNYANSGYAETEKRLASLNQTNGGDGDYDAFDADAVVQAAIYGEVRYG